MGKTVVAMALWLGVLCWTAGAWAVTSLSEGFEDGALEPPYAYKCDIPQPSGCTNVATTQNTVFNAGARAFKGVYNEGGAAGMIFYEADYQAFPRTAYLRFYMNLGSTFRAYSRTKVLRWIINGGPDLYINCNGVRTNPWSFDVDGAQQCDLGVYFGFDPSNACNFNNEFYYVGHASGANRGAAWVITAGSGWWYVEAMVDLVNRRYSMWMKRPQDTTYTQVINNLSLAGCSGLGGTETFEELEFGWINDVGGGSGGPWYLDDIAVSDVFNGPVGGSSDTTPPANPAGLTIRP